MPVRASGPPSRRVRRNRLIVLSAGVAVLLALSVIGGVVWGARLTDAAAQTPPTGTRTASPSATPTPRPAPQSTAAPTAIPPSFDRHARSIDDPASIWVVSDKKRALNPPDFVPPDLVDVPVAHTWDPQLRAEASAQLVAMFAAASAEAGLHLASNSAYRSYDSQVSVYNQDVGAHGQDAADQSTARPGFSEHQTGLAIDIGAESGNCSLDACFANTQEGTWLAQNAYRFGFLLRYPADKVPVTGFEFEPWHYRYIGVDLATEMHDTGVTTLEEFFGLPAAPTY
ncbi:D-alanyl-D-alanine carboxypeptidase family protein [Rathayibacter sp. YIM 133350]|uniref:M15 family metallopeptidase n=1 Tax=Rathayibacter sp. YIM 133350 TaxID=3131992 RepID=UPI00307ECF02